MPDHETKLIVVAVCSKAGSAASSPELVTEEDFEHVLAVLSQDDTGVDGNWEEVVDKQADTVYYNAKRRDPKVRKLKIFTRFEKSFAFECQISESWMEFFRMEELRSI